MTIKKQTFIFFLSAFFILVSGKSFSSLTDTNEEEDYNNLPATALQLASIIVSTENPNLKCDKLRNNQDINYKKVKCRNLTNNVQDFLQKMGTLEELNKQIQNKTFVKNILKLSSHTDENPFNMLSTPQQKSILSEVIRFESQVKKKGETVFWRFADKEGREKETGDSFSKGILSGSIHDCSRMLGSNASACTWVYLYNKLLCNEVSKSTWIAEKINDRKKAFISALNTLDDKEFKKEDIDSLIKRVENLPPTDYTTYKKFHDKYTALIGCAQGEFKGQCAYNGNPEEKNCNLLSAPYNMSLRYTSIEKASKNEELIKSTLYYVAIEENKAIELNNHKNRADPHKGDWYATGKAPLYILNPILNIFGAGEFFHPKYQRKEIMGKMKKF